MIDTATLEPETAEWLESERKIPAEVAARCGVVTVNARPAFEYRLNGELKYRKLRIDGPNGKSFARDRKGATSCLFLEDVIQEDPDLSCPLVICEGEIDALSLVASGVPNVVSVPDGAQLDEIGKGQIVPEEDRAFGWLWDGDRLKSHLKQFERIVLATDADRKGRILRDELAVRFEAWRCHAVTYPKGCKDANEVLVKHGPAKLLEIVETAVPLVPDRLVRFGDIPERGPIERLSSGFEGLDDYLKLSFVLPEFVVITGEPGSGKSEFSAILGANLANYHGLPGAILQFEDRSVRVRETLIRYALGNLADISDRASARAWVDQWFRTIEPEQNLEDGHDYTLEWLEESIREARVRHGCRWVILDPWNEIEHVWERGRSETQYINDALRRLKRIARAHQIILMVVAHPSKEGARIKDIADLDLYSISGSAAWANKADHGIILHRPNKASEEVHIKVAKSKDHAVMGLPGTVTMRYVPMKARYAFVRMGI